jgi:hypothetical protein
MKDKAESDLHNVRRMAVATLAGTWFCPSSPQAVTKGSNMVSITTSKRVITKCLNTEQKCSWATTL